MGTQNRTLVNGNMFFCFSLPGGLIVTHAPNTGLTKPCIPPKTWSSASPLRAPRPENASSASVRSSTKWSWSCVRHGSQSRETPRRGGGPRTVSQDTPNSGRRSPQTFRPSTPVASLRVSDCDFVLRLHPTLPSGATRAIRFPGTAGCLFLVDVPNWWGFSSWLPFKAYQKGVPSKRHPVG